MLGLQTFLLLLLTVSTFTSLSVEAAKKILNEFNIKYHSNLLTLIISFVLSIFIFISYLIIYNISFSNVIIVYLISLTLLSGLTAMCGYDKVMQAIEQIRRE